MKYNLNRRTFLKRTALATGALSTAAVFPSRSAFARRAAGDKLNCVQIGCGGRGLTSHIDWLVNQSKDNLVAIVDPDEKRQAEVKRFLQNHEQDPAKLQVFTDYRKMFDKIGKQMDAVFIA